MERIYLNLDKVGEILDYRRQVDHIERYLNIRRFVFGTVLDFGCGIGYGANLLSQNPDVKKIIGTDIRDSELKEHQSEFGKGGEIIFVRPDEVTEYVDVFVALEVIEHLEDPEEMVEMISRTDPSVLIISFPNKPSIKYNPFHYHDYAEQDVIDLFVGYAAVNRLETKDVTILLFFKAPAEMPFDQYRNLLSVWK